MMQVIVISSEGELQALQTSANGRLLVLEAALTWCRPCKGLQVCPLHHPFARYSTQSCRGVQAASCQH